MAKTYCNPLSIPDIPSGRWLDTSLTRTNPADFADYRSISDPNAVSLTAFGEAEYEMVFT